MEDTVFVWGIPQEVQLSEKVQVPGGTRRGLTKGIILQGGQLKRRFYCGSPVIPDKKRGCNGIVYLCTQIEEYYVCIDGQTVYI